MGNQIDYRIKRLQPGLIELPESKVPTQQLIVVGVEQPFPFVFTFIFKFGCFGSRSYTEIFLNSKQFARSSFILLDMGLKRLVSSMMRSSQLRSSKAGQVVAGRRSVLNEDGMWNSKVQRQTAGGPGKPHEHDLEQRSRRNAAGLAPAPYRLPRKRCWLSKRKDFELQEK